MVHLNVIRSQLGGGERARRGFCVRGQPYYTGTPGHLGRVLITCLQAR